LNAIAVDRSMYQQSSNFGSRSDEIHRQVRSLNPAILPENKQKFS